MEKVLMSWSGGKDSAMALREIMADGDYEIAALLTTVTADYDRISMHGVRRTLLEQQAASLGLPLETVILPKGASNEDYESRMAEALERHKKAGVTSVVFGDIFLEDLREYREKKLARLGMKGVFPLWKRETAQLMQNFIARGFKAVTVCVDNQFLGKEFVGREIDARFVADLPAAVDVCGENGEYHSFVYGGPMFGHEITHDIGEVVLREDRFYYCDLIPAQRC
jgi:uncharacterized protein (TIGR00290 family)